MIPLRDSIPCYSKPIVCWAIMAICSIVFLYTQSLSEPAQHYFMSLYGMVPARYSDERWGLIHQIPFDNGLSFVSNLFLHGGWFHLIINLLFIWIFAKSVEARMGHGLFWCFYLLCGLIATATQWIFAPHLVVPVVGASGAIAGVLGAYFFLYPYAKVTVLWFPALFEIPAIAFLGFWVIVQLHEATTSVVFGEPTTVAWWAHLGGFIAGAALHRLFLSQETHEEVL